MRRGWEGPADEASFLAYRYYGTGVIFGKMLCLIICVDYILLAMLDFFYPRDEIDIAPKFELKKWHQVSRALSRRG